MPPRGKKAQVKPEQVLTEENSGDEQVLGDAGTDAPEAKPRARGKPVSTKAKGRGKTVEVLKEPENDEEVDEEPPVTKPLSKAAQKKKQVEMVSKVIDAPVEEEKKGRGRGKKAASTSDDITENLAVGEETSEQQPAPKKGRGRQKKEVVEDSEAEVKMTTGKGSKPAKVSPVPATTEEGADKDIVASNTEVTEPVEKQKTGRGRGKKAVTSTEEPENVPVAEEMSKKVPEEKKKRGGRAKKEVAKEEDVSPSELSDHQVEEQDDNKEPQTGSPLVSKKGRSKKAPQKAVEDDAQNADPKDENVSGGEQLATVPEPKKKAGRGRKAEAVASTEVDPPADNSDLPIYNAPSSNIEVRKVRGNSRPTTPVLPKSPIQGEPVEVKKGRGRAKKTPVVTPQREPSENSRKGARGAKVTATEKEDTGDEQISEEPVVEKKRTGRPKKTVEKTLSDAEEDSPTMPRSDRKRKEGASESQIAKKASKQK